MSILGVKFVEKPYFQLKMSIFWQNLPSQKPYLQVCLQTRQFPNKIIKDVEFWAKSAEKPLFQKIQLTQQCRFGAHFQGNPYLQVCLQTWQFPSKIIKDVDFGANVAEKPLFQKILLTQQFPTKVWGKFSREPLSTNWAVSNPILVQ